MKIIIVFITNFDVFQTTVVISIVSELILWLYDLDSFDIERVEQILCLSADKK